MMNENSKRQEDVKFKRKYQPVKKNIIRPIKYKDHERTLLGDTEVKSNTIGRDNDKILGMFCYDWHE